MFHRKEKILDSRRFFLYDSTGDEMERIVEQGLLYDFYGELLTEHQRRIYEDVVLRDLSLTEIAQEEGISRQGVHDLVRRCDRILAEYEQKLKLIEKFHQTREKVEEILRLTEEYDASRGGETIRRIQQIAGEILYV